MKETKNPVGPPKKVIDWELFEQLCVVQCTQSEIASMLKIHTDTLRDRAREHYNESDYSEIYKKYSESGKCSLRRYQFALAKTNTSMSIWLGKQWLGQKDHEDTNKSVPPNDQAMTVTLDLIRENQSLKERLLSVEDKLKNVISIYPVTHTLAMENEK